MWQSSALLLSPSSPFFPQALPCAALGYFTTKSNRNHGASFGSFGGTRHKSRLITQPATLLQLFRVPLEPITQGSRQQPKPQLPLTPDYLPCTEIHNVCSFIVRGFFLSFFFVRVWGGVPSKDAAQVLQIALIALLVLLLRALLIIVAQMMYYIQCTLGIFILISVILMAHTHTHSQTLAYRQ